MMVLVNGGMQLFKIRGNNTYYYKNSFKFVLLSFLTFDVTPL